MKKTLKARARAPAPSAKGHDADAPHGPERLTALAVRLAVSAALATVAAALAWAAGTVGRRRGRTPIRRPPPPAADGPLAGSALLLVEDDADSRDAMSTLLQLEGAVVTAVADAETALARLSETRAPPRAVVCDVDLPGLDGVGFLPPLRALERRRGWRRTPVLALTASAGAGQRQRLLDAGFAAHLSKPGQAAELLRLLERACGLPEQPMSPHPPPSSTPHRRRSPTMNQKAKHPAQDDQVQGEGNIDAARRYNAGLRKHMKTGDSAAEARQAAPVDQAKAAELERAERRGKERAREEDPQVRTAPRGGAR